MKTLIAVFTLCMVILPPAAWAQTGEQKGAGSSEVHDGGRGHTNGTGLGK